MRIQFGQVLLKNRKNTYTQVQEITQILKVYLMYHKQAKPANIYSTQAQPKPNGEGNYEKFQEHLKTKNIEVDLVKHPELVEETKYAVLSALWYWQRNNLSDYAIDLKVSTALKISKLVNCGNLNYCGCEKDEEGKCKKDEKGNNIKCTDCAPNGWDDRKSKFEKYKNQIPCE